MTDRGDADICNICGEERRALIHTDAELHPDDARDGLTLHEFEPIPDESDVRSEALARVADELRNIRRSCDWNAPPPRSIYAALRQSENVARMALGQPLADDCIHDGKFTSMSASDALPQFELCPECGKPWNEPSGCARRGEHR